MNWRFKPLILTCGEPAGIGPEITALAWHSLRSGGPAFVYIGDADYLKERAEAASLAVPVLPVRTIAEAAGQFSDRLPVLHRPLTCRPAPGRFDTANSAAVIAAIDEAVRLIGEGEASALVTNPIQKEALYAIGFMHQGHTDYLASLAAKTGQAFTEVMMLATGDLRVVPVTVHIPLRDVPKLLTEQIIINQALVVEKALRERFRISKPRLALTGLNPHAGENGAMGDEEQHIIRPAIERLRASGLSVTGPVSADTAFHAAARRNYDAILCMYHDQALIPVKSIDFHGCVNITLGLPFIRTSPDHGTALDIAGTGQANPMSLISALRLAAELGAP